jgi:hypothetical protein
VWGDVICSVRWRDEMARFLGCLFGRTLCDGWAALLYITRCCYFVMSFVFELCRVPLSIMAEAYYKTELRELMTLPENKSEPLPIPLRTRLII